MTTDRFTVSEADFEAQGEAIRAIRFAVFVQEQGVPIELEMDEEDAKCRHVLAWAGGEAIATGRLLDDGHIGRIAVMRPWRRKGVGQLIMATLLDLARSRGDCKVALASQLSAAGFYHKLGFKETSGVYPEAGIDHVDMELELR